MKHLYTILAEEVGGKKPEARPERRRKDHNRGS
jgi:hypothetical protein